MTVTVIFVAWNSSSINTCRKNATINLSCFVTSNRGYHTQTLGRQIKSRIRVSRVEYYKQPRVTGSVGSWRAHPVSGTEPLFTAICSSPRTARRTPSFQRCRQCNPFWLLSQNAVQVSISRSLFTAWDARDITGTAPSKCLHSQGTRSNVWRRFYLWQLRREVLASGG